MGRIVGGLKVQEQASVYPAQAACYMCLVVPGSSPLYHTCSSEGLPGPRLSRAAGRAFLKDRYN